MVKFRKKTHRKINKKSKRSIKGGARYYCYTEGELGKIKRDAATGTSGSPFLAAEAAKEARAMVGQTAAEAAMQQDNDDHTRKRDEVPTEYLTASEPLDTAAGRSPPRGRARLERQDSLSSEEGDTSGGGSKKRKRRKKKKTRKARGIMDDLRTLCTTGRCGSPTPQTPTLREVALTIERNMIEDFNTNSPEKTLTAKDRRNIKILANHEAARIVNTSSSASKKKKKKKKKKKRNL